VSNHFDIASKYPFDVDPAGMLGICGLTVNGPVSPYKTDLSTRLDADRLFLVKGKIPWLAHVEIQSGPEQFLDLRVERYNICAEYQVAKESKFRRHLPVISTLVLLHPKADSPKLTGKRIRTDPNGNVKGTFRYNVIRLWRIPVARLLNGPIASLVFATLAKVRKEDIPKIVERIEERLAKEADPDVAREIRTDAWFLMGLRFSEEFALSCPWRRELMHQSSTYQWVLDEGIEQGIEQGIVIGKRDALFKLGQRKFGPVTKANQKAMNAIVNAEQLDRLIDQIDHVKSWNELFAIKRSGK
jgi:hypothetical protein